MLIGGEELDGSRLFFVAAPCLLNNSLSMYEAEELDRALWAAYRETLRREFRQETLVMRVQAVELS